MTILLLGAGGQLGSELRGTLGDLENVVAVGRRGVTSSEGMPQAAIDLADTDALRSLVRQVRPRIIVNAAAYTAVDAAESDVAAAHAINAVAPGVLAEAAAELDAALVHYSTDYVFNDAATRPWREDDPVDPLNTYGRSKAAGEAAIRSSGARHLILRTGWLYGAGGRNFVKTMLRLAARQHNIAVVDDQRGTPTSVRFVAQVTRALFAQAAGDSEWFDARGGTLHVACAGETSWHGFAVAIFDQAVSLGLLPFGPQVRPISSAEYPTPARRPKYSTLDTGKLRETYAIVPPDWLRELHSELPGVYASLMDGASRDPEAM